MIGTSVHSRRRFTTSTPSMSGRPRSRITTSGRRVPTSTRPFDPVSASNSSMPCGGSTVRSRRRICGSSSISTTSGCGSLIAARRSLRFPASVRPAASAAEARSVKRTPPSARFSAQMRPRCASTIARQMASPRPGAAGRAFGSSAIELVEHALFFAREAGPAPDRPPTLRRPSSTAVARTSIGERGGVYFTALSSRFVST